METSNGNPERAPESEDPADGPEETTEPGVDLNREIQDLKAQLKDKDAKYLYLYAEFENFKKRAFKERDDARKFGWENVALDLLEVADNLERAVAHMPPTVDQNLAQGIQLVLTQFRSALPKNGVQEIDALKKPFDPNFHEAVGQEPSTDPAGIVTKIHQKGYTLHGRLLRPVRVAVSSGPSN